MFPLQLLQINAFSITIESVLAKAIPGIAVVMIEEKTQISKSPDPDAQIEKILLKFRGGGNRWRSRENKFKNRWNCQTKKSKLGFSI